MNKWLRINTHPCLPLGPDGRRISECKKHTDFSRKAACEGMVLLKNLNNTLPLKAPARVAIFGTGQIDYVTGGGGSGTVYTSYCHNIYDGFKIKEKEGKAEVFGELSEFYKREVLRQYYEKDRNYSRHRALHDGYLGKTEEPEIPESLLRKSAVYADTAIIVIKRFSGEALDRTSDKGDFYLTDAEQKMIEDVTAYFKKTVLVLNIGGTIDCGFFKDNDKISAVLLAWQSGQEGGLAIADIICGDENPSGKLADTLVSSFDDYPSSYNFNESEDFVNYTDDIYVGYRYFETIPDKAQRVCYPFGFGLSYTTFELSDIKAIKDGDLIKISLTVKNTGTVAGKEVIQIYSSAPQGKLGKPVKELKAFKKTELLNPNESKEYSLYFKISELASFDDLGKIQKSAFVLEKGEYSFFVGTSVRDTAKCEYTLTVEKDMVVKQLTQLAAPTELKERMLSDGSMEKLPKAKLKNYTAHSEIPNAKAPESKGDFIKVFEKEITLDEFMAQLSTDELIELLGGKPSRSVTNVGCFGGNDRLGIPFVPTMDGPAGVRIEVENVYATAWPIATQIACSFNEELAEKIGEYGALELKENNGGVWLTPALNIHRSALCGRNFEYYSEDPYLSGKMAAAMTRGIQSQGVAASVKHFACNNKETNRRNSDSRVSERALREIYLKGFEIVIKEAEPITVMTSYNKVNGRYSSENYDLITGILRGEWGFKGMVTTDWDNFASQDCEILAGNDIRMTCNQTEKIKEALESGKLTKGDIYACAKRVLEMILKLS